MTLTQITELASRQIANTSLTMIPDDPAHNARALGRLEAICEMLTHAVVTYRGNRSGKAWEALDARRDSAAEIRDAIKTRAARYAAKDFAA